MHEVFISYSSRHRELTRHLAEAIERQYGPGSVWWDQELEARSSYAKQIRAALERSRVVVVVWTAGALVSDYVYAEATLAFAAHKLVNVRPDEIHFRQIPEPFNIHHVEDASATERILHAIGRTLAGTPLPTRLPLHELYWRQHGQRLLDTKQGSLSADLLRVSPSQLLQARYAQVSYVDASGLRAEFLNWALSSSVFTAGRILYGPGGTGKTRLLIEVANTLRSNHDWAAGFVEGPAHAGEATRTQYRQALEQIILLGDEPGLLLVLDYAEGRREEILEIVEWLASPVAKRERPIRIVLLARTVGDWWDRLRNENELVQGTFRDDPDRTAVEKMPAFDLLDQRVKLLEVTCEAYGKALRSQGLHPRSLEESTELREDIADASRFQSPLEIQMRVLLWLADASENSRGVAKMLDQILGLERRHWSRVLGPMEEDERTALERGLAQVTLLQGLPTKQASEALLMQDKYYAGHRTAPVDTARVLSHLTRLYDNGEGGLVPLQPDLIGEHLVAKLGDSPLLEGCIAWLESDAHKYLPDVNLAFQTLVTVLERATHDDHGSQASASAGQLLDQLIRSHLPNWAPAIVRAATGAPMRFTERLDRLLPILSPEGLEALHRALDGWELFLDSIPVKVAERLLDLKQATLHAGRDGDPAESQVQLAALHSNLASMLQSSDARRAASLSLRAVEILRQVAFAQPNRKLPELPLALAASAECSAESHDYDEAVASLEEAVSICLGMINQSSPDMYIYGVLAFCQGSLAIRLLDLDRRDEAAAASDTALASYRAISPTPTTYQYLANLAVILRQRSTVLSAFGLFQEALSAADEAARIHEITYQATDDESLGGLLRRSGFVRHREAIALALNTHKDAMKLAEDALYLYRSVLTSGQPAFMPYLAARLEDLSTMFLAHGLGEIALEAARDAMVVYGILGQLDPQTFLPELAICLNRMGQILPTLGRTEEGQAFTDDANRLASHFVETPGLLSWESIRFRRRNNEDHQLSSTLGGLNKVLVFSSDFIQPLRKLAIDRPDIFLASLESSLELLGEALAEHGDYERALTAFDCSSRAYCGVNSNQREHDFEHATHEMWKLLDQPPPFSRFRMMQARRRAFELFAHRPNDPLHAVRQLGRRSLVQACADKRQEAAAIAEAALAALDQNAYRGDDADRQLALILEDLRSPKCALFDISGTAADS
ncbi:toll/interleukin-1 receptor domain-containing protein [Aquincola sp. S2]|uniref:Toll/interleukin-1 receptor domain-containing protein n=1 Tax=Pseudaquabacterium terrae TaxID=2732868 RepID=A0ABX2EF78_9BURK|nr:toll/interleukin-1 receptor domain-containing protein [Aquabacterium terrae]NRF67267.1 toll/interleukin-1 receptor domain-containing protein [Aquabacterium terrae]